MHENSAIYYIVLRGALRRPIFRNPGDYQSFSGIVGSAAAELGVKVHAFCWTDADARLAAEIQATPAGEFARRIVQEHSRCLAPEITITGSNFERQRYRGIRIEGEAAMLELVRHIHLAPVKSGLAPHPAAYAWSSHRAYLGLEEVSWLTTGRVLSAFAAEDDCRQAFAAFVQDG